MSRVFIIVTKDATKSQQRAITAVLKEMKLGWWHHFPNTWMASTNSASLTATQLRDAIKEVLSPTPAHYVFELDKSHQYAGMMPVALQGWVKARWKE